MKTLILNRHAKSDWNHPGLTDFNRPLNKRGLSNAPFMASKFKERNISVDFIFSSPANRAKTTAEFFIKELGISKEKVIFEREIYSDGISFIRNTLPNLSNNINTIMFFGHNPDLSALVTYYTSETQIYLPSCGIAIINFEISDWKDIDSINGTLEVFDFPKNYL